MASSAEARFDELYQWLPPMECQRLCQESCGPILMSKVEWERICTRLGFTPNGNRALTCPMLKGGQCTVYDIRPLICRLWGLVKKMACPNGCIPSRWLSDAEARLFLTLADQIGNP